jgi:hypothetical protein
VAYMMKDFTTPFIGHSETHSELAGRKPGSDWRLTASAIENGWKQVTSNVSVVIP